MDRRYVELKIWFEHSFDSYRRTNSYNEFGLIESFYFCLFSFSCYKNLQKKLHLMILIPRPLRMHFWGEKGGAWIFFTYLCSTTQLLWAYSDILGAFLIYKTQFSSIKDLKNFQCLAVNMSNFGFQFWA